jgi:GNAT superfamily N-acetyltransferase
MLARDPQARTPPADGPDGVSHFGDNREMVPTIAFSESVDGVDWRALKAALAADDFDNGRTPDEYETSHRNSFGAVFAIDGDRYVGNARILSDGVCNAYVVDVWTATAYRRRGIGSELVRRMLARVRDQHVYLFTDDMAEFYRRLGFSVQPDGMGMVVGSWLSRDPRP